MKIKSINLTTTKVNQEVMPRTENGYPYNARGLTLAVSKDTNIYINGSEEAVLIKANYGLTLTKDIMVVNSITVQENGCEIYCLFSY